MRYFSEEMKRTLVVKMNVPGGRSANSLSKEVGISQSTLSRWLREGIALGSNGESMKQRRPEDWTAEEKVEAILSYEKLSEEQRGVFLREKGLHDMHLEGGRPSSSRR